MATTEDLRHELHDVLRTEIGHRPASTLMGALPPVGWADMATKRDLDHLDTSVRLHLQTKINGLFFKLFFAVLASQAAFATVIISALKP